MPAGPAAANGSASMTTAVVSDAGMIAMAGSRVPGPYQPCGGSTRISLPPEGFG